MATNVSPEVVEQAVLGGLNAAEPWSSAENLFGVALDDDGAAMPWASAEGVFGVALDDGAEALDTVPYGTRRHQTTGS